MNAVPIHFQKPKWLVSFLWPIVWTSLIIILFLLFLHRTWFIPQTDYIAYYRAGQRALSGENLYAPDLTPFKYLPIVSYLFVPLSLLPYQISKLLFFFISFGLGVLVYVQIHRRLGNFGTLFVLASMIRFHNYDFLNSQINHILLIFWFYYLNLRIERPVIASFLFSILASFKIVPLLLVTPLFFLKKYKEVGWILLFFTILSFIPLFSFHHGTDIYLNWLHLMQDTTPFPAPGDALFQSIQGALWYWLGPLLPNAYWFSATSYGIQALLVAFTCFYASQVSHPKDENRILIACFILTIIASPLAWKHNYLLILPAFVSLLEIKQYRVASIGFILMALFVGVLAPFSQDWVDRSYVTLLGALIIFFALFCKSEIFHGDFSKHEKRDPKKDII